MRVVSGATFEVQLGIRFPGVLKIFSGLKKDSVTARVSLGAAALGDLLLRFP